MRPITQRHKDALIAFDQRAHFTDDGYERVMLELGVSRLEAKRLVHDGCDKITSNFSKEGLGTRATNVLINGCIRLGISTTREIIDKLKTQPMFFRWLKNSGKKTSDELNEWILGKKGGENELCPECGRRYERKIYINIYWRPGWSGEVFFETEDDAIKHSEDRPGYVETIRIK